MSRVSSVEELASRRQPSVHGHGSGASQTGEHDGAGNQRRAAEAGAHAHSAVAGAVPGGIRRGSAQRAPATSGAADRLAIAGDGAGRSVGTSGAEGAGTGK